MGFGSHRLAHHWRLFVVYQPLGEIHCTAGSQASEDVGRGHGAACSDDEVDRGVL